MEGTRGGADRKGKVAGVTQEWIVKQQCFVAMETNIFISTERQRSNLLVKTASAILLSCCCAAHRRQHNRPSPSRCSTTAATEEVLKSQYRKDEKKHRLLR